VRACDPGRVPSPRPAVRTCDPGRGVRARGPGGAERARGFVRAAGQKINVV